MALDSKTTKQIEEFVHSSPRTIQEIAHLLQRNWRTADSYVSKISDESGTISVRTFREGTRGALKIVFWNNLERINTSEFQSQLFKSIQTGKKKSDFSAFDIYQFVDDSKRNAFAIETDDELNAKHNLAELLMQASSSVLIFSGNLSWLNSKNSDMLLLIEKLAKKGVKFKVLTRIDIASIRNLDKIMSINKKLGKDVIEIRHSEQPLRAFIIDDKVASLKEVKDPSSYKAGELDKKTIIYYELQDKDWIEWLKRVFFKLYRSSVQFKKRDEDLKTIKNLTVI